MSADMYTENPLQILVLVGKKQNGLFLRLRIGFDVVEINAGVTGVKGCVALGVRRSVKMPA